MPMKKWLKALIVAIGAILAGIAYRMGGSGNFPRQARIIGVSALSTLVLALITWKAGLWLILAYVVCFGLSCGAISTYWKRKGTDAHWWNWVLHGLGLSLACLPFSIATGHYLGFGIRTIVLTALITVWSELIGNAVIEELGRGALICLTLPLLLI